MRVGVVTEWTLETITSAVAIFGRCWGTMRPKFTNTLIRHRKQCVLPRRHEGKCRWRLPKPSQSLREMPF